MKKIIVLLVSLSICVIANAANPGTTLFSDNFDRSTAQEADIDASTAGMSGSAAPLTYVEQGDNLIGTDTFTNITNNQLHMAYGPNASSMYIDHNFSDTQILTDKGLRVGMTIVSNDGNFTDHDRWVGFGIGNSLEEVTNSLLDYNLDGEFGTTAPFYRFRGSLDRGTNAPGISDIHIGWSPLDGGVIEVFKNGSTVTGGENYNIAGIVLSGNGDDRLELELYFDDMNEGTEVEAYILWNSEVVGIDSFTWDHTNENYIGITARQGGNGFTVDDLKIDTIFNDRATPVSPSNGLIDVDPEAEVVLEWTPGIGATVTEHLVSVTATLDDLGEPNFAGSGAMYTEVSVTNGTTFTIPSSSIDFDQTIYWKVDEVYSDHTALGIISSFETLKSLPVIETQPESILVDIGNDVEFTCVFSSLSEPTKVEWFKNEVSLGVVTPVYDSENALYSTTLTIETVEITNEGVYYCEISNLAIQPGDEPTQTETVNLGIKQLKAHWKLEAFDSDNGVYTDETGDHPADPNTDPLTTQFVANSADPVELGNALDLSEIGDAAADSGVWAPAAYTGQVTFSAWINISAHGAWQGIISNRTAPNAEEGNVWLEITPSGTLQLGVPGSSFTTPDAISTNQWLHVAATAGPDGVIVYINGVPVVENTNAITINTLDVPVFVGCLNRVGETLEMANPFNGQLDDLRVYNYVLSHKAVIDLYYEMLETAVCLNPDDPLLVFDSNGDCKVDIVDFSYLAADWFNCNWYPVSGCE